MGQLLRSDDARAFHSVHDVHAGVHQDALDLGGLAACWPTAAGAPAPAAPTAPTATTATAGTSASSRLALQRRQHLLTVGCNEYLVTKLA